MKIHQIAALTAVCVLAGCNAEDEQPTTGGVQIPNPASVHCVDVGGKTVTIEDEDGNQIGICHLPDGTEIEEWELFRKDHPQP